MRHVLLGFGVVQRRKLQRQFVRVLWLNFRLRPGFEEPLDTLMPEALDHPCVVYSITIRIVQRQSTGHYGSGAIEKPALYKDLWDVRN